VAARKERDRRAALEALAGEALDDLGGEYNPFLEDGETRAPDDDATDLALAATIAGGSDDDSDLLNPFQSADKDKDEDDDEALAASFAAGSDGAGEASKGD
jgi:hypothetical protein